MKTLYLSLVIALLSSANLTGQSAAPGTGAVAPAGSTAAKPKLLGSADKKFIKDALTSIYFELQLAGKVRTAKGKGSEPVKKIGVKLYADLNKAWGDFATVAQARGEKVPDELSGSDKTAIQRLTKLDAAAFDKEFLDLVGKESKKLVRDFEAGAKSIQDAEVKAAAEKWTPLLKRHAEQIEAAAAAR